ncbi:MAG: argininosuccinate lyase [Thermoplasmata archaeon]|nr:argininosuccinate lyase [Candidatus Sysuiplasma acidicola]MBX8645869.1 argininosuccinate lyase [Candidatus Sysuiplasma acidicola]MDH2904753.1 argininosuccinate lyase [Methanomassiliicoccales archaeon]
MSEKKLWSGRFSDSLNPDALDFSSSPEDFKLFKHDIVGSIAHAGGLRRARLLTPQEFAEIKTGLAAIYRENASDPGLFLKGEEDVHMAVESRLTAMLPVAGQKLHTARSRNDQIALDLRLYVREQTSETARMVAALQKTLLNVARAHRRTAMPSYTHLQRAQPVFLSHHMLAHFWRFERDFDRLRGNGRRMDVSPLGAGAIAGTSHPIDTRYTAELLGFSRPFSNSMDATSDRDFVIDACFANAMLGLHLSSIAEEMVLWSSAEFSYIELPDSLSTGSSIMPHKKNPDMAEHIRGKSSSLFSALFEVMSILKSLPVGYASDMQHTKRPLFRSFDTLSSMLSMVSALLTGVRFNSEALRLSASDDFSFSVEAVDMLVRAGMPFREAHETVGRAVKASLDSGRSFRETLSEQGTILPAGASEAIEMRSSRGGSSSARITEQLRDAAEALAAEQAWVRRETGRLSSIERRLLR